MLGACLLVLSITHLLNMYLIFYLLSNIGVSSLEAWISFLYIWHSMLCLTLGLSDNFQVAQNTAVSLARLSRNLHYLDLSWCRNLTNEALGLIVDGCLSLKVLKLFGCTQV